VEEALDFRRELKILEVNEAIRLEKLIKFKNEKEKEKLKKK
jgi:hypothetical protein